MEKFGSDQMILSTNVSLFKDPEYELMEEPIHFDVVTCAAVIANSFLITTKQITKKINNVMRERIHSIMTVLAQNHYDCIILGAFGCGAFGCDKLTVATAFYEELKAGNCDCQQAEFAVYDSRGDTFALFRDVMKCE